MTFSKCNVIVYIRKGGDIMAMIEMNALSTILCGSFSAKVFFPEMDKLGLGENDYDKKYPVLWLYHSDGGSSMDWLCTPAEKCSRKRNLYYRSRCSALSVYQYGVWTKI